MGFLDWLFKRRKADSAPAQPTAVQPSPPSNQGSSVSRPPPADEGIGADIARMADEFLAEQNRRKVRIDRSAERFIDAAAMRDALSELGQILHDQGQSVDLAVYGGSCLMLASNFRESSGDVDAVTFREDWSVIRGPAQAIADRRGWPPDWINNNVQNFLGKKPLDPDHHVLEGTYPDLARPGLKVFVPTAPYALAMKLRAMRIDLDNDKDLDDIIHLMIAAEVKDKDELVQIARTFYLEKEFGGKLYAALNDIWEEYRSAQERLKDDPPRYLG